MVIAFRQYLNEQKQQSKAPQGIIFKNDKVVFVGSEHGTPIKLSDDIVERVKQIGSKYGFWYEGVGMDAKENKKLFGDESNYKGSWDNDGFAKDTKGYPYEFIYTLFSNTAVNGQKKNLVSPNISIFNSILKNQKKMSYFKDREFGPSELKKFLSEGSEKDLDFLQMSKQLATKENVADFIDKGEQLMWPKDWEKYPNKLGKLAYEANLKRNKYLLSRQEGVYIAGSGHLLELKDIDKSLEIVGGEDIE